MPTMKTLAPPWGNDMLKLMYITNRPEIAKIAQDNGVDRIFVDMEYLGKDQRQKGLDTVKSHHTLADVAALRGVLDRADLMVRINPVHRGVSGVPDTSEEIDGAIAAGAEVLMLPFFKTPEEVETFLCTVNGRARTMLLVETPQAVARIDEILALGRIDEIHIGLNDLSLGYGQRFLFQPLADGTVDRLCAKLRARSIPYGFGGIARLGGGLVPAEVIIREHYRLGSERAILSRSFCDASEISDLAQVETLFRSGMAELRTFEASFDRSAAALEANRLDLVGRVERVVRQMEGGV